MSKKQYQLYVPKKTRLKYSKIWGGYNENINGCL